ncbi:MAG TPA: ester cyclase [Ktedonobacterales bacterium]|jgi:steroid delta-isomerase-like uncharacterized protein|nr:ester cyclase [Ktedonobacterales bacterium]
MPQEQHRTPQDVTAQLLCAWNEHDLNALSALYASEYEGQDVASAGANLGQQGVSAAIARYFEAFPDLQFSAETVIEGNRAAVAWQATGTHSGVFMHIPPTGRKVSVRGSAFFTIEGGKITRGMHVWDVAGLLRAIGLLPEL